MSGSTSQRSTAPTRKPWMRAALVALSLVAAPASSRPDDGGRVDVLAWFAMSPPQLGCWLEETFGHRDPRWSCDLKDWKTSGDPCEDIGPYYEGPEFPDAIASRVDRRMAGISLEWEHGELRELTARFDGAVSEGEARRALGLPAKGAPAGFLSVSFQRCSRTGPCLVLQKFEHMGAGEVDCGAGDAEETGPRPR